MGFGSPLIGTRHFKVQLNYIFFTEEFRNYSDLFNQKKIKSKILFFVCANKITKAASCITTQKSGKKITPVRGLPFLISKTRILLYFRGAILFFTVNQNLNTQRLQIPLVHHSDLKTIPRNIIVHSGSTTMKP